MTNDATADAGTVRTDYWKTSPGVCYDTTSLNLLTLDGSTSAGTSIETEVDKARTLMNGAQSSITISSDSSSNCTTAYRVDVISHDFDRTDLLASESAVQVSYDPSAKLTSTIKFNSDITWKVGGTGCSITLVNIEWVANHEFGHTMGLEHHTHDTATSMMDEFCNAKNSTLQTVDNTAMGIKYTTT